MKRMFRSLIVCLAALALLVPVAALADATVAQHEALDVASLHSPHPYPADADDRYTFTSPNAAYLDVTFSADTYVEPERDFITLTAGSGATVGTFTGAQLSGRTIRVTGDTVTIRLQSDQSVGAYGFTVTSVTTDAHAGSVVTFREPVENVRLGQRVTAEARQTAGRPMAFYIWQVVDQNGSLVSQVTTGGTDRTYAYTPVKAGVYRLGVTGYDGTAYTETCYGNWFAVVSSEPPVIEASQDKIVYTSGDTVTITAKQTAGGQIQCYHFVVMDEYGRGVYEVNTVSPTITWIAEVEKTSVFRVLAQAYDGWDWCSAYGERFTVFPKETAPFDGVAVSLPSDRFRGDSTMTILVNVLENWQVRLYRCSLQTIDGQTLTSVESASPIVTCRVPNVSYYLRVVAQVYDGENWHTGYSDWFVVIPKTTIKAGCSADTIQLGDMIWISVREISGGRIALQHFVVYDEQGNVVDVADLPDGNSDYAYRPKAPGVYRALVQVYDGFSWCYDYTDWFSVVGPDPSAPTVYRALLVGETYPGTDMAIPYATKNNVEGMRGMLGSLTATPYQTYAEVDTMDASSLSLRIQEAFGEATAKDVSLLYCFGHGRENTGALVFQNGGAISPAQLRLALDQVRGTKIVIIEACHSGYMIGKGMEKADGTAFARRFLSAFATTSRADNLAEEGYYVLVSCGSEEQSYMNSLQNPDACGYFTHTLLRGCGWEAVPSVPFPRLERMEADANGDDMVTLNELYVYLRENRPEVPWLEDPVYNVQVYPENSLFVLFAR